MEKAKEIKKLERELKALEGMPWPLSTSKLNRLRCVQSELMEARLEAAVELELAQEVQ